MATDRPRGGPGARPADGGGSYPEDIDARERYVLYCLSKHGSMGLWDLADEVIVWETGRRLPDIPPGKCRTTYLALYHTHVPRLELAGLIEYRANRDVVALADAAIGLACREPRRPADGERATLPYEP